MKRTLLSLILVPVLLASCSSAPEKRPVNPLETAWTPQSPELYFTTDYKGRASGVSIPDWVNSLREAGISGIESMNKYNDKFVFLSRNEGSNFNALAQWANGFSAKLDFPRLAAARIEARFLNNIIFPEDEYGTFYEALVRAASDMSWSGAAIEDSFWSRRVFVPEENENSETTVQAEEKWEFLILVSMEKTLFASQLDTLFRSIKPVPQPKRDQTAAANRVKERFYEGF